MRFNAFLKPEEVSSDSRKQTFEARISRQTKQQPHAVEEPEMLLLASHSPKLSFYYYCIHNFLLKICERRFHALEPAAAAATTLDSLPSL